MNISFASIVVVGAHFDDIEIGCGGLLAKAIKSGSVVTAIIVGDGDYRDIHGTAMRTAHQALKENGQSLSSLGVQNIVTLSFPESKIPYDAESISAIEAILEKTNPELIITHWTHDTHQDHQNTSRATIAASRYHDSIWMWEPIFPSGRSPVLNFSPRIYVDISTEIDQKIRSIEFHQSQVEKFFKKGIRWTDGIRSRAAFRGFESGCSFAETFEPVRMKL